MIIFIFDLQLGRIFFQNWLWASEISMNPWENDGITVEWDLIYKQRILELYSNEYI